ncbi:MAG: LuxR C-terminal-related transcriptional regulator, partial [Mariprofundus sp.]
TKAVIAVAAGRGYIEARLAAQMQAGSRDIDPMEALTTREFEVFSMLAVGRSVDEVAELLHLSNKTVGAHRTSIMKKLGLKNSAELARAAIVWNLVKVPTHI